MTETDRDYISGDADVDENKRYQAISRVRDRFDELERDVETLEDSHPGLLRELREIVCAEDDSMGEFERIVAELVDSYERIDREDMETAISELSDIAGVEGPDAE